MSVTKAPSTRIRIFLTADHFWPGYGFHPHANSVFGNQNWSFMKTVSRFFHRVFFGVVWTEENGGFGKRWREMSQIGKNDLKTLRVDAYSFHFENGEKNLHFKNIRIRVDRQKWFENVTCGRGFFENESKKDPFSKISGYVLTGPERVWFGFKFIGRGMGNRS